MRIGFVSTYPPIECGIATYMQYLSESLREKHADVYVVSHMGGEGHQVFPCFDYEDGDLAEKAFSMMSRFTPDVVHIQHEFGLYGKHSGVAVIPLILQFRLVGIPVVTTLHTVYPQIQADHQIIFQSIFLNSDRVIIHEPYQERSLRKNLREDLTRKICVIPHGAREVETIPDAKKRLGLPTDKKVVLMIGYIRPSKNFELVVDIFPEILEKFPNAILVIGGKIRGTENIDYRNMLFNKIAQSPQTDQIYLIRGQLPQHIFDTIISSADVVVLPYKIASQSGILAHCLAFGKPIVTSSSEAMRQILDESEAGLTCLNSSEFIENIVRVLSDDQLSQKLSLNAKKYVKDVTSWSRVADQHLDIYKALLDMPKIKSHVIMVE
ncbi:MAG: glycosyltransferase [Deltaproteobacteria bacterium]|nr:glycosyltransferase [Deltaproteobacteria bacterium]MBW2086258.1 glycosyltransferase [Deltaproteobacteria bacterium]